MHVTAPLINLIKKFKKSLLVILVSGLFSSILLVVNAILISKIVALIFVEQKGLDSIQTPILLLFTTFIARSVFLWISSCSSSFFALNIKSYLKSSIIEKIEKLGPVYVQSNNCGELAGRFSKGADAIETYYRDFIPNLIFALLIPPVITLFIFPEDWISGLIILFTLPLAPFFMILIGQRADCLIKKQWEELYRMGSCFLDTIRGLTSLKIMGLSRRESETIRTTSKNFAYSTNKVLRVAFLSSLVLELVATLSVAVIAVVIGVRMLDGGIGLEAGLFILILAPEAYSPLRKLGSSFHAGEEGVTASEPIFAMLDEEVIHTPHGSEIDIDIDEDINIRFESVGFKYHQDDTFQLTDATFEIPAKSLTAIVGETGSGKTTILNILLGFISPDNGKVYVNNTDLSKLDISKWRESINYMPQDPYLFHTTIKENIRIADKNADDTTIMKALNSSGMKDFIKSLPEGIDTTVGERGARLSGGQAQRVAIARAIVNGGNVTILDEPTSNLDKYLEEEIMSNLDSISHGKSVIMIAHRLSTVKKADSIIVMDKGKVAAQGTHIELLETCAKYRQLIEAHDE